MIWIWRVLFPLLKFGARRRFAAKAQARALLVYLKFLRIVRRSLLLLLFTFLALQTMIIGFVGACVTGVWLMDVDPHAKLQILFILFAALLVLPALALVFLFSERVWLKASGAEALLEKMDRSPS